MTDVPKRGTQLTGRDAGFVADGVGGRIEPATYRRWKREQGIERDRARKDPAPKHGPVDDETLYRYIGSYGRAF